MLNNLGFLIIRAYESKNVILRQPHEALEMYTTKASYAIFEENIKGTLESGKLADVIILDRDILSAPQDAIDRIKVVATIKSGDIIYKKIKSEDIKIESKDI